MIANEGGWDTKITQGTVISPSVVKKAKPQIERFVNGFNEFLADNGIGPVSIGHFTGSSYYHEIDPEDAIYGDIDLQLVVPEIEGTEDFTASRIQSYWYELMDRYVKSKNPDFIHDESEPGHPILSIGDKEWVQIDLMPHVLRLAKWGAARTIPERGMKGLLHGNMFSVLGEMLTMSIQHAGVQFKERGGMKQPYSTTRKDYVLRTISTDPETFVLDIFKHECDLQGVKNPKIDPLLARHPGKDLANVKIGNLVNAVKGLARSFELNGMYGKGDLSRYESASDFINKFWKIYESKALKDVESSKRGKAETSQALARAESDRKKIMQGLEKVKDLFFQD